METHVVEIDAAGRVRFVYADTLAPLLQLGAAAVERVSLVGWTAKGWCASLAAVGGPFIGPLPTYAEAVAAEVAWLQANGSPAVDFGGVKQP